MRLLFLFSFLPLICLAHTNNQEYKRVRSFEKLSSELNENLDDSEALFRFKCDILSLQDSSLSIIYSIDGVQKNDTLTNGSFGVKTTPGKHIFVIYYSEDYSEVYSDSLEIRSKHVDTYNVNTWQMDGLEMFVDKPVIYLYPSKETDFSVRVIPKGSFTFTYPEYSNEWSGTASEDGTISIYGVNYRYLFWESTQKIEVINTRETEGFVVHSEQLMPFLERTLTAIGFTSEEQVDFITFWAPKMIEHDQVFIRFHQNEACDSFAELHVTPTPDHLERFYMSWAPYGNEFIPASQELKPLQRNGFTVLEWGGQQVLLQTLQTDL